MQFSINRKIHFVGMVCVRFFSRHGKRCSEEESVWVRTCCNVHFLLMFIYQQKNVFSWMPFSPLQSSFSSLSTTNLMVFAAFFCCCCYKMKWIDFSILKTLALLFFFGLHRIQLINYLFTLCGYAECIAFTILEYSFISLDALHSVWFGGRKKTVNEHFFYWFFLYNDKNGKFFN